MARASSNRLITSLPWPETLWMLSTSACLRPPRLHADAALLHHHMIGQSAAALRAAELQILQRLVALAGVDDRLEVGGRLMVAGHLQDTNR